MHWKKSDVTDDVRAPLRGDAWTAALLLASALACTRSNRDTTMVVHDSAGIQIVENRWPAWEARQAWRVDPVPILDVGTLDGGEPYQLFGVADAVRLSDGRVVMINGGSAELRCFASNGELLWSAGQEGDGPSEFRVPVWLRRLDGDTIAVYDYRLRRLSIIGDDGTFVRAFQTPPDAEGQRVTAVGLFGDGSVLLQTVGRVATQGKYRDTLTYYRFTEDQGIVARVGRFPGWEKFFWSQGRTRGLADHPFGLGSFPVAHGDEFILGNTDQYELASYTADGTLRRIVRREYTRLPVTSGDVDRYREEQIEAARAFWQDLFPHVTFPQTMPAYRRLLVDSDGFFWVEEYRRPGDDVPRWTVFAPDGQLLGTLTLPTGTHVFEIGTDYVLGRWQDQLDVEHVRVFSLLRQNAEASPDIGSER